MCPTAEDNGIRVTMDKSGDCKVVGPLQHLRLNIEGARMATYYGAPHGEEFQLGDRVVSL